MLNCRGRTSAIFSTTGGRSPKGKSRSSAEYRTGSVPARQMTAGKSTGREGSLKFPVSSARYVISCLVASSCTHTHFMILGRSAASCSWVCWMGGALGRWRCLTVMASGMPRSSLTLVLLLRSREASGPVSISPAGREWSQRWGWVTCGLRLHLQGGDCQEKGRGRPQMWEV